MDEGTWICPTCTLENSTNQLQCPVCFTPKPIIRPLYFAPSLRRRFAAKLFSLFLGVCFFSLSNTLSGYIFPTTPYIFDEAALQTLKTLLQTDDLTAEGLLNGLSLEEENALVQTLVVAWLQIICLLFYLVFFQSFGDLLAKQSFGLYILQPNGDIDKSLKRELLNCLFTVVFPIDLFLLLLTERRISDYVLGTQVVQALPSSPQNTPPLMRSLAFAFALGAGCLATDLAHAYVTLNTVNLLQNPTFSQGFESWDVTCPNNFEFIREGWTSAVEYRPSFGQGSLCTMQQYVGDLLELDNFYEIKVKIWAPPPTDRPPLLPVEHPILLLEHVSLSGDRSPVLSTRPHLHVPPTLPGAVHDLSFQFAATESLLEDFPVLALSILRPASLEQSEAIRIYSISMIEHRTK